MRSLYLNQDIHLSYKVEVSKEKSHHLCNVLRLKPGEEILLLNGLGHRSLAVIETISKNSTTFKIVQTEFIERAFGIDMALGLVKKEALELSVKQAIELGVKKLIVFRAQFSDAAPVKAQRLEKLIESSMEQSNNPYYLEIEFIDSLDVINFESYESVNCYHLADDSNEKRSPSKSSSLIIIGPEGGLSNKEIELLSSKRANFIKLPTPIMRAPTALSAAVGHTLGKLY